MKKRLLFLLLPVITLILEISPYGAVCNFASAYGVVHRETFSYFDLVVFGYANFSPLFTATITCVIFVLLVIYLFTNKYRVIAITKVLLCIGVILSICPLLYGINYFSLVGALITALLIAESVLLFTSVKRQIGI